MDSKKIIGIAAAAVVIAIILIVILTKAGKLEEVKLPLQVDVLERTVTATVRYPKNKGITVEDTDYDSNKVIKNESKNYSIEIDITEDSTYADNKDYAKEEEGYEEVKFNDYTGYIVKGSYDVEGYVLLEDLGDQNIYVYLRFEVSAIESYIDDDYVDVEKLYKLDEVQKILNSLKYDKGENTKEDTQKAISDKEEEEKTSNYGEFANRSRTEGTSDKDGLIFIKSFTSPDETLYRAEQRNDNVGIDNYLWYISDKSAYNASCIEVRVFPKDSEYSSLDEYKEDKGDLYHWSKSKIAGKEYDTYTFGDDSSIPEKYSKYYSGAFMVGNKVVEFSYNMYKEIPDQDLGDKFFTQIMDSIEYSKKFTE